MKELPLHFEGKGEVKGYRFTQIKNPGWGFIYEVEQGGYKHYEVFKRRVKVNPYTGIEYVRYPNSNAFGKWAWTYMSIEKAKAKLLTINIKKECLSYD